MIRSAERLRTALGLAALAACFAATAILEGSTWPA